MRRTIKRVGGYKTKQEWGGGPRGKEVKGVMKKSSWVKKGGGKGKKLEKRQALFVKGKREATFLCAKVGDTRKSERGTSAAKTSTKH